MFYNNSNQLLELLFMLINLVNILDNCIKDLFVDDCLFKIDNTNTRIIKAHGTDNIYVILQLDTFM